jgi:sulfur carrier protein
MSFRMGLVVRNLQVSAKQVLITQWVRTDNFESRMTLTINGATREFNSASSLSALLIQLNLKFDRIAVELNRELIPRDRWDATQLADGDKLEIVHFVGGGKS